ncbi:MAG: VWA domain-containing protein [Holophagaceae bacterium]|nr:VWA domain-containing protein [Holophagaceae bacterium]
MMPFTHPELFWPTVAVAALALAAGLFVALRPGVGIRVVGQRPAWQGLGLALIALGVGLGLAEPRYGRPEVPRLTVHILLDASRSMLATDAAAKAGGPGRTRWRAAVETLDHLFAKPVPGVRFSLTLLTGDTIPLVPPGEDRALLRDSLRAVQPGEIGSPGTSLGRGLAQLAASVPPREPAVVLFIGDGEETWETPEAAKARALAALKTAGLPLDTLCLGGNTPASLPRAEAQAAEKELSSIARPEFLKDLAEAGGGKALELREDLAARYSDLAEGKEALPVTRSKQPAHPEWGAWLALLGLGVWLAGAGKALAAWRPVLGLLLLAALAGPARAAAPAELPLPPSVQAWLAQRALAQGDLEGAQRWKPTGGKPRHQLLAALIDLRTGHPDAALLSLAPLTGQGAPRPLPEWRTPALLLAARAQLQLEKTDEAKALLERLLREDPGQAEAVHDLQSLIPDQKPPPPNPKPPPPPPRPSQGARQDELEGIQQRMPKRNPPPAGVKDI